MTSDNGLVMAVLIEFQKTCDNLHKTQLIWRGNLEKKTRNSYKPDIDHNWWMLLQI